MMKPLSGDKHQ